MRSTMPPATATRMPTVRTPASATCSTLPGNALCCWSGAGPFTLKRYFRSGTLYITLNSSVIRNQLSFQKEALIEKMNATLSGDPLFTSDNRTAGYVKELVLR